MDSRKGWWVVLGCVLALTITMGVGMFSMAVLAKDIITSNGWSEKDFALGITIWALSAALVSPLCGYWIDKFGPRRMMVVGIIFGALCEAALSLASSIPALYLILAVMPLGIMLCTYIPVATVVSHWFRKRLTIATGIAMLGIGLGGGLFPAITLELVNGIGYRMTFIVLAFILLSALVPVLLLVYSPEDELDNDDEEVDDSETFDPERDVSLVQSLKTRSFWGLSLADMLTGMVFTVFTQLLVLYLTNSAGDEGYATLVHTLLTAGLGFGILVFGPLGDIFNFRRVLVMCYFLPAVGTMLLFTSTAPAFGISFAIIAGIAGGGRSALFPVAVVNSFGGTHMAAIYGVSNMVFMLGNAIGPWVAGEIYDRTGEPQYIYGLSVVTFVVSAVLVALIRDERKPKPAEL